MHIKHNTRAMQCYNIRAIQLIFENMSKRVYISVKLVCCDYLTVYTFIEMSNQYAYVASSGHLLLLCRYINQYGSQNGRQI